MFGFIQLRKLYSSSVHQLVVVVVDCADGRIGPTLVNISRLGNRRQQRRTHGEIQKSLGAGAILLLWFVEVRIGRRPLPSYQHG